MNRPTQAEPNLPTTHLLVRYQLMKAFWQRCEWQTISIFWTSPAITAPDTTTETADVRLALDLSSAEKQQLTLAMLESKSER